ncbi:MAG: hypothetical protein E6614_28005, partial [Bradyrhizobium sp.]|nr:hypothetical protein [Bradyrhizobium sp.]
MRKKFAKRGFGDKDAGAKGKRSFDDGRAPRRRDDGDAPRKSYGDKPRFNRDERPRGDRPFAARPARAADGEKRAFKPRGDRPKFDRDERSGEKRPYTPRANRDEARPAGRSSERKFGERKPYAGRERDGDKRPYTPRGEGARDRGDRPRADRSFGDRPPRTGDRPERKFGGERKFSRGAEGDRGERKFGAGPRGPRKEFGDRPQRGETKPWQKRGADGDRPERSPRAPREGGRSFERPRSDRPREDRPKFDRPKFDKPKFDRPRRPEGRTDWQEHPRSERRGGDFGDRPRRDNEDDSRVFAKRPAFGGRGAYRKRKPETDKRVKRVVPDEAPKPGKAGDRIAKVLARAGLASRRDADIAFRIVPFTEPDIVQRRLMSMPYALYGTAETAQTVQHDPAAVGLILMNTAQSHFSDVAWLLDGFPLSRRVFTSTSRAVQAQMCQRGMGMAVLPQPLGDALSGLQRIGTPTPPPS